MTVVKVIPFPVSIDEQSPSKKYPYLAGGAFTEPLQLDIGNYTLMITYNLWGNSPQLSVLDSFRNHVLSNIPMRPRTTVNAPNLIPAPALKGYQLFWDIKTGLTLYAE